MPAAAMLERYAASAERHWRRSEFIGLHHLRAVLALSAGDAVTAIAEAEQALDYAQRFGGPHQIANQCQLLATGLAATGNPAALGPIETLRQVAAQTGNASFLLHADLAEAHLAQATGGDSATPWCRAAEAALRHGFRRIAGMHRPRLAALANHALAAGADPVLTRRTVALWQLPPPARAAHPLWPFAVEIRALGGFTVEVDGTRIGMGTGKAQRKPMELLWCLLAGPPDGLAQESLADELWPEADGDRALHSLRSTIYRLRKLLGATAIRHEDDHVALAPGQVRADVLQLGAMLGIARDRQAGLAERLRALDQAIERYRGPLLPGIRLPSVIAARERLAAELAVEGAALLLTQDPAAAQTLLRAGRLRAVAPGISLPKPLAI
jgi:LuxR family transcriptional regulator, maltose regulon positive regulatory protein